MSPVSTSAHRTRPAAVRAPRVALLAALALLSSSACSILTSYPERVGPSLREFEKGQFPNACEGLAGGTTSTLDSVAYLLEQGTCYHTSGDYERSNAVFLKAIEQMKALEEKALISASDVAAASASLLINEKTIPYEGEPFEKVLVHAYLAINYLLVGDPENARVEVRAMEEKLKAEAGEQSKDLDKASKQYSGEARDAGPGAAPSEGDLAKAAQPIFEGQQEILGRIPNVFRYQNGFARYLSSLGYEMSATGPADTAAYNDAYIDIKKAFELRPDAKFLAPDLIRLSRASQIMDEYQGWKARFPDVEEPPKSSGFLVVLFENGLAPQKEPFKIWLPTKGGYFTIALPRYRTIPNPVTGAALYAQEGRSLGSTAVLTDVEAIAVKTLSDRMLALVLKQAVRAALKAVATAEADSVGGGLAGLAASILGDILEQADLRSWLFLPQDLQVLRVPLKPGDHHLRVAITGRADEVLDSRDFDISIRQGKVAVLNLRSADARILTLKLVP